MDAEAVVRAGAPEGPLTTSRTAFMRYSGQGHEIEIALPNRDLAPGDTVYLTKLFETAYMGQFSRVVPGMEIEILNWAVRVSTLPKPITALPPVSSRRAAQPVTHRTVYCDQTGAPVKAAIYDRDALAPGDTLAGPALIVEPQTTTLASAGFHVSVDSDRNLVLTRGTPKEASS